MESKRSFWDKFVISSLCILGLVPFLRADRASAQTNPLIQQKDLSSKTLEELWNEANAPGKALCFVKMNPNDQLAVIISPSLGFGAITEKGKSGKLNLGYQTDSPASVTRKGNLLTISYKGDNHRKACSVSMEVEGAKIRSAKATPNCTDYEDGQDHFEGDLIGASAILSSSH